jgi:diguanylate cyclase (GGDEF)-like protein
MSHADEATAAFADRMLDAESPPLRNARQMQLLLMVGALNLVTIPIDFLVLGRHVALALTLRLAVVTPFVLGGLALCRFVRSIRLQVLASATAIIVLALVSVSLGQFADEPFASRYMMATLFLIFGAALSVALPWHTTKWMTAISTLAFAVIVGTGLNYPLRLANLDLVLFCITAAASALYLRHRKDQQLAQVVDLRRIDSSHAEKLREANHSLSLLSHTDPLTGVFNRRYLDGFVDKIAASIAPYAGYGVLMVDVDRFKLLNDLSGHLHGDECLRQIATTLQRGLRSSDDFVIRYGGEEFAVVLPDADLGETLAVAERLRAMVAEQRIPHPGLGPDGTLSVSIGAYSATISDDVIEALRCADRALYGAKQSGRNRVAAGPAKAHGLV